MGGASSSQSQKIVDQDNSINPPSQAKKEKKIQDEVYDVKRIYWDVDGNLRYGSSERNRDAEILDILLADSSDDDDEEKIWMIMPSRWLKQWLLFSYYKVSEAPGKIDMFLLLKQDDTVDGGWRPKYTLKPAAASKDPTVVDTPGHYRRVTLEVWLKLVDLYGLQGYAIAVWGVPVDDMRRWRVFKNPRVIDISVLPPPLLNLSEEEKSKPPPAPPSRNKLFMGVKTVARYGH